MKKVNKRTWKTHDRFPWVYAYNKCIMQVALVFSSFLYVVGSFFQFVLSQIMLVNSCKLKRFSVSYFSFSIPLSSIHNDMAMVWRFLLSKHIKKKYSKSSPRWQYNNSGNKDIKAATELLEDERDPDVIPAQFCKFFIFTWW